MSRDLQIVLKIAERCNIDCTYCYYFNSGNESPFSRPKVISENVIDAVEAFVRRSSELIDLGNVRVILHGGEPLMVNKVRYASICETLIRLRDIRPDMSIVMSTNAMLIDDDWIDIFEKYQVGVCVSLDGPREYHDLERLDFKGRGTYDRTIQGINKLRRAAAAGRVNHPGVIAVINPRSRGDIVYNHLVREFGFRTVDFLVPLTPHDSNPSKDDIEGVGRFLVDAFNEWVIDDDPTIHIRNFDKYLSRMLGVEGEEDRNPTAIVAGVGSDGTIINDDGMQILGPHIFDRGLNVLHSDILEYLHELTQGELAGVYEPYQECVNCRWFEVCRPANLSWLGGEMRYSKSNGFQNKLVHCEAFQDLFRAMKSYVDESTIPALASGTYS